MCLSSWTNFQELQNVFSCKISALSGERAVDDAERELKKLYCIENLKMKSAVVLFLISISVILNAQHLVDTNNVWSTVECMSGGSCGTTVVTFGSDTLIGSYITKRFWRQLIQ